VVSRQLAMFHAAIGSFADSIFARSYGRESSLHGIAWLDTEDIRQDRRRRRPERFTQDFLESMLGFGGASARAFIPLLKRMQFISSDGTPTALYDQYRNDGTRSAALAAGVRNAYSEIFDRNQFVFNLPRDKLTSLVREMTGLPKDSQVGRMIVATFWTLKHGADFAAKPDEGSAGTLAITPPAPTGDNNTPPARDEQEDVQLRIGYTINLNLPETTNPDVFNAIFKSLKEHLLRK
jgi:Family of unknown function (DUF5343)